MSTLKTTNLQHASAASPAIVLADDGSATAALSSLNGGPLSGARNRIINGAMAVDQRYAGSSVSTSGGSLYTLDRWYVGANGGSVTVQRVAGAVANTFSLRVTGGAGVTSAFVGQRIEALNSADLAGQTVTLSVDLSNSLLTTVAWNLYYANSTDSFGTLASPTVTSISSGTFTVNSTSTRYSTQINIPAAATTGLMLTFDVGAQTSGTFTVRNVQLEPGTVATPFERRSYGQELALCQRYYQTIQPTVYTYVAGSATVYLPVTWSTMRDTPVAGTISQTLYSNTVSVTLAPEGPSGGRLNQATSAAGYGGASGNYSLSKEL